MSSSSSSSSSSSFSSSGSIDLLLEIAATATTLVSRAAEIISKRNASTSQRRSRRYLVRNREAAHDRLVQDYFAENAIFQGYYFRRRFRMYKSLYEKICTDLTRECVYFQQRYDARRALGFSPIQKMTAALRQLAYATPADALDESLRMSARVSRKSLFKFCKFVMKYYGPKYLRYPTEKDVQQLYAHHANVHGFPGMLGSIDCMHWKWGKCPVAHQGEHTRGDIKTPTVILEAVASQDLWIWHAYFGAAGANNDLNVLEMSPVFSRFCNGTAPDTSFQVQGNAYKYGYYLGDEIYHPYAVLVKSFSCPNDVKRAKFKKAQEKARKDVERAFGVLKQRWHILRTPSLFTKRRMMDIMYTCIILHNMIIEHEGKAICVYDEDEVIPEIIPDAYKSPAWNIRETEIRHSEVHHQLRADLVEHIYYGTDHLDLNVEPEGLEDEYSDEDFQ